MKEQLDRLLDNSYAENEAGAAVLVTINDQIVYQRCRALANVELNESITTKTNFRLASLTKQFTAYGIFLLEQQGQLSINDRLEKFFPRIKSPVTVRHLLDHSSGLLDYEEFPLPSNRDQWTDDDVLQTLTDQTYFEPGTKFRYSNTGYILLGLIIEFVSNESLEKFFHRTIFEPFGMKRRFSVESDRALGYRGTQLCDQSPTSATRGDGGLYMSLDDYLQWYRHSSLIRTSSIFPIDSSGFFYHYGWFFGDSTGRFRLHTGDSCGFTHQVFRLDDDEQKILVLYLSNSGDNEKNIEKFNEVLLEELPVFNGDEIDLLRNGRKFSR